MDIDLKHKKKQVIESIFKHYKDQTFDKAKRDVLVKPISILEMLDDLEKAMNEIVEFE